MSGSVTHINLLQRNTATHPVAWTLGALLVLTLGGAGYYGSQLRAVAAEAMRQRAEVAQQLKGVQASIAVRTGEQAKSAGALALRKEVDALQPRAQVAQALVDALRATEGGRADEFSRALTASTGVAEPGLWLTALTVGAGGKRLELQGEAGNGAAVLRFARRANDALRPLALRLDTLEMQPPPGAAASAPVGAVAFKLY